MKVLLGEPDPLGAPILIFQRGRASRPAPPSSEGKRAHHAGPRSKPPPDSCRVLAHPLPPKTPTVRCPGTDHSPLHRDTSVPKRGNAGLLAYRVTLVRSQLIYGSFTVISYSRPSNKVVFIQHHFLITLMR